MTRKKWLYITGIIVLMVPVLFLYNAFNGNPVSKYVAIKSLESHLEKNYPDDAFKVNKPYYDFKMSGYNFKVLKIGDDRKEYEFIMRGALGTFVASDGIYDANMDRPLIKRLEREANEQLLSLLEERVPELSKVEVQLEVLKGKYDHDVTFDHDFKPEKPMYVYMVVEADGLGKEDMLAISNTIQGTLNEADYDYDDVTIDGTIFNPRYSEEPHVTWYVIYSVGFSKDTDLKLKDIEQIEK